MTQIDVVAPQELSEGERAAVARLYVAAFRRKLRAPLGPDPIAFVASQLDADRLLLAKDAEQVLGIAGLRYDGRGFFDPTPSRFRAHFGLSGRLRSAAWRWT